MDVDVQAKTETRIGPSGSEGSTPSKLNRARCLGMFPVDRNGIKRGGSQTQSRGNGSEV